MSAAVLLAGCRPSSAGPKSIYADGVTYTACGGAMWLRNEDNPKDAVSFSYDVLFTDAQGVKHELRRVRNLTVTDLPADTPACKTAPKR